jgi:uncharacterized protein YbcC (UPF0753/DUF2309 family)
VPFDSKGSTNTTLRAQKPQHSNITFNLTIPVCLLFLKSVCAVHTQVNDACQKKWMFYFIFVNDLEIIIDLICRNTAAYAISS